MSLHAKVRSMQQLTSMQQPAAFCNAMLPALPTLPLFTNMRPVLIMLLTMHRWPIVSVHEGRAVRAVPLFCRVGPLALYDYLRMASKPVSCLACSKWSTSTNDQLEKCWIKWKACNVPTSCRGCVACRRSTMYGSCWHMAFFCSALDSSTVVHPGGTFWVRVCGRWCICVAAWL